MEDLDLKVKEALEIIGSKVENIPRGSGKSADFKIEINGVFSIIEVKTMNDRLDSHEEYFSKLESRQAFEFVGSKDTRKSIKKASEQVEASYENLDANGFKGIAVYSNATNALVDMQRRLYDFYGFCDFYYLRGNIKTGITPGFTTCIGFYKSIFDIYADIDFILLMSDFSSNVLMNDRSPRYEIISNSETLSLFNSSNEWKIIDPARAENGSGVISLGNRELAVSNPGNVFGKELHAHERSAEVIAAKNELCRKYGFSSMHMEENRGRSIVIGC